MCIYSGLKTGSVKITKIPLSMFCAILGSTQQQCAGRHYLLCHFFRFLEPQNWYFRWKHNIDIFCDHNTFSIYSYMWESLSISLCEQSKGQFISENTRMTHSIATSWSSTQAKVELIKPTVPQNKFW